MSIRLQSGKSSLINSLAAKPVVPVYIMTASTDAWSTTTTRAYEVEVEAASRKINIIDTPGVSLKNEKEHDDNLKVRDMLLRSRGRVDKVKDPAPAGKLHFFISHVITAVFNFIITI